MLTVDNLTVRFHTRFGPETAIEQVSIDVQPGEIHGLVGESGAGKSTLGAAIMGLLPADAQVQADSLRLDSTELLMLKPRARHELRGKRISMIFQDPQTSLNPLMTIEEQLLETMLAHDELTLDQARERALGLLEEMGIRRARERLQAYPHQFSGGMRQRVVIALALCTNPDLIIADEPTTALDVAVQSQVLDLLRELVTRRQLGMLLITHDIGVIAQVTDRVTVLQQGRRVESGNTSQVLDAPQEAYTQQLLASVPRLDKRLERFSVPLTGTSETTTIRKEGSRLPAGISADYAANWLQQGPQSRHHSSIPLTLAIENLSVTFRDRRQSLFKRPDATTALQNMSLSIRSGEVLGLVGESGSGKSTLAKVVAGLVQPATGDMSFMGQPLPTGRHRSRRDPSRRWIQMIFQDPYSSLNNRRRISSILAEPLKVYGLVSDKTERLRLVGSFLELVGLPAAAMWRYPHQFSGGQRQRIAIARALIAQPEFLICDEPTSALDVSIQAQVLNLLKDLQSRFHLTILFISHNLAVVRQMADRVAVLQNGVLLELADNQEFFQAPEHPYSRQLLALTPTLGRDPLPDISRDVV